MTPGVDTDVFTVTGQGRAWRVDDHHGVRHDRAARGERHRPAPTSVAIHVPDLLFYSQAEIDTALDALQSVGVTDIRVLVPWAAVEPVQGLGRLERGGPSVINSAAARNIKVLGVLNSTPTWAAVPNQRCPLAGMPSDNAQFAAFAGLAAAR